MAEAIGIHVQTLLAAVAGQAANHSTVSLIEHRLDELARDGESYSESDR